MGCLTMGEVEVSLELNITAANAPSIRVAIAGSIPHIKIFAGLCVGGRLSLIHI